MCDLANASSCENYRPRWVLGRRGAFSGFVFLFLCSFAACSPPFPDSSGGTNAFIAALLLAPRLSISETDGFTRVNEGGGPDSYSLALSLKPEAAVVVRVVPDGQLLVNSSNTTVELTFTPENWNVPQSVSVAARDDRKAEGAHRGFVTHLVNSADSSFNGMAGGGVTVDISADNDVVGISVISDELLATTESGGMATFTVVMDSEPTGSVTLALNSTNTMEGVVTPTTLVFTEADWNVPRTVTITGVDDAIPDAAQIYMIATSVVSSPDAAYASIDPVDVDIENSDDELSVNKLVFRTKAKFDGDLDGNNDGNPMPEADALCNADKAKPSGDTYKALLVDGVNRRASVTSNAGDGRIDWVFAPGTAYFRNNGTTPIFTTNAQGLFIFGTLTNSFSRSQNPFWSGLEADWTTHANTCTGWTVNAGGANRGRQGRVNETDGNAVSQGSQRCNRTRRLLCVMQ